MIWSIKHLPDTDHTSRTHGGDHHRNLKNRSMSGHQEKRTQIKQSNNLNECAITKTPTKAPSRTRRPKRKKKHDAQSHMEPRKTTNK